MDLDTELVELAPWTIREYRRGSGPPVVLLHGLSGSFAWWKRNVGPLSEHFSVIGIDLIGFGAERSFFDSPLPLPMDDAVALLRRWIETRIGEPVNLVGHSMGGQLAIHLAATHPELVRSLVLVASAGLRIDLDPGPHLRAALRPPSAALSFLPTLIRDFLRAGPTSVGLALTEILRDDVTPLLPRIPVPTLLVWGENDPLIPLPYAELFRDGIPDSSLEILENAGHVPMWDQARAFNETLIEFFGSIEERDQTSGTSTTPWFQWGLSGCERGICHRSSGDNPDVVLIHGLGIRSGYFRGLARALSRTGLVAIAPDLPGFGHSGSVVTRSLEETVAAVIAWADAKNLQHRVWAGHSTGAQIVRMVAIARPDLVSRSVFVSPIWSRRSWLRVRLLLGIAIDTFREPARLVAIAARAYWESGMVRFMKSFARYTREASTCSDFPDASIIVYGNADPLVDREYLGKLAIPLRTLDGAHGVVYSNPATIAAYVGES